MDEMAAECLGHPGATRELFQPELVLDRHGRRARGRYAAALALPCCRLFDFGPTSGLTKYGHANAAGSWADFNHYVTPVGQPRGRVSPCGKHVEIFHQLAFLGGGAFPAVNHYARIAPLRRHQRSSDESSDQPEWKVVVHLARTWESSQIYDLHVVSPFEANAAL